MTDGSPTAVLGGFTAHASPPASTLAAAERAVERSVQRAEGARSGPVAVLLRMLADSPPVGCRTVRPRGLTDDVRVTDAAMLNTVLMVAPDDPAAQVLATTGIAAALAVGDWLELERPEVVVAAAVAFELAARLHPAVGADLDARGWDAAAVLAPVVATAAAARLLRLAPDDVRQALGLALTQSGGLGSVAGTGAQLLQYGAAAADGVEAALLVQAGLTAPRTGLEGRRSFLSVTIGRSDFDVVLAGLGQTWRPYPIAGGPGS